MSTNVYNIAICDDNKEFLDTMKNTIEANSEYASGMIIHLFLSGGELLTAGVEEYNLVILDMQMDYMNGYEVAKEIRRRNKDIVLAFCSGVIMPQPEHFEVQPYRYLLKKIDTDKMQANISDLLMEMKQRKKSGMVEVVSYGKWYRVSISDIVYIERLKRGSKLVIEQEDKGNGAISKEIQSNENLEEWYRQLSEEGFEFVHKSYMVNMQKIVSIVKSDILMSNNQVLSITRTCRQKFSERFAHYFSKKYRRDMDK